MRPHEGAAAWRLAAAALVGGGTAAVYSFATGLAFHAHSRAWEMGAIPLVLAAFVFVGLLAGTAAALLNRERPYLAAVCAMVVLFAIAAGVNELREELTPGMTRDERREFWANIEGLLFGGGPIGVPFALWGALLANPGPGRRLRVLRDGTYGFAGFVAFVALIPAGVHWLPWRAGIPVAALMALAVTLWLARRNRRAASPP